MKVLDQCIGERFAIYHGDCCDVIKAIPSESVGYSIFSPPFASLYTYSNSLRDLGNVRSHDEFYAHFGFLLPELLRVLKPGRSVSIHCMDLPTSKERDGVIGLTDFRGILVKAAQEAGFILHSQVTIWKDPVTAMQRTKALGLLWKTIKKDSSMSRQGIADYLVTLTKPGEAREPVPGDATAMLLRLWQEVAPAQLVTFRKPGTNPEPIAHAPEDIPVAEWQRLASPIWNDINPSDTLQKESAREDQDERHIAPLQLEVYRRGMRLWSNPGDVVFEPFVGIGSGCKVALELGRRYAGAELKASYFRQAAANGKAAEESGGKQASIFDLLDSNPTTETAQPTAAAE